MIVFGTRMYGKKNVVNGYGYCEHCGKYGKNTSYTGRKFGHVYYIPLIPSGPRVRVVKECKKCTHGMHFPETEVPGIIDELRQTTEKALTALIAGKKEFDDNGTMTPCTAFLAGNIELLYCLGAEARVKFILSKLEEKRLTQEYQIVLGESLEFQGKLDEAAASYQRAVDSDPSDTMPLLSLGSVYLNKNDLPKAKEVYERALELSKEKLPVLQVLITVYESLNEYDKLAQTYEWCFSLVPGLSGDKKVLKAYRKACKKSGRNPLDV